MIGKSSKWLIIGAALLFLIFAASRGSPQAQQPTREGHGGHQTEKATDAPAETMEQMEGHGAGHMKQDSEQMKPDASMEHGAMENMGESQPPAGREGHGGHQMEAPSPEGQPGQGKGIPASLSEKVRDGGWKAYLINLVKRAESYVRAFMGKEEPDAKTEHAAQRPAPEPEKPEGHAGHQAAPAATPKTGDETMPSAPGTVMLSPERQQLTGVTTAPVEFRQLIKPLRTVGTVGYDERKVAHVHTKISGWVEELTVDYTGRLVKKGDPLFTLYSPELVSTQEEYLLALRAKKYFSASSFSEISDGGISLLKATRRRLLLWDITAEQIENLEKTGETKKNLTIYSPLNGYVTEKMAFEGMFVNPEQSLYTIADLSTVWIYADIYEYELPFVKLGQKAAVTLSYYPGEVFEGKVIYIYPYLEPKTRTVKVRLEFQNRDTKLKPEMYADVQLQIDAGRKLAVPEEAVLDSGARQIVFVAMGDGHYEPREVKLGPKVGKYYEVLEGLKEKEMIVTSANFLIDSESQLQSATGGMAGHGGH